MNIPLQVVFWEGKGNGKCLMQKFLKHLNSSELGVKFIEITKKRS